jgi:hypothetical protein
MAYQKSNKEFFNVSGKVSAVSKTGKQICISDGDDRMWFGAYAVDDLLGVGKGDQVEFRYYVSGTFNNIDSKSFKITKKIAAPAAPAGSGSGTTGGNGNYGQNVGVEIGMSINNAVQIAIAEGNTDIAHIKSVAFGIYKISADMREWALKEKEKAALAASTPSETPHEEEKPKQEKQPKAQIKPPVVEEPMNDDIPF